MKKKNQNSAHTLQESVCVCVPLEIIRKDKIPCAIQA